jgi:hypothetical protein
MRFGLVVEADVAYHLSSYLDKIPACQVSLGDSKHRSVAFPAPKKASTRKYDESNFWIMTPRAHFHITPDFLKKQFIQVSGFAGQS